jgi:MFS family permease
MTSPVPITAHTSTDTDRLLPSSRFGNEANSDEVIHEERIPWSTLFPLVLYRIVDTTTYLLIFPFITEFLLSLNVNPTRVGLYAGTAEGCLMLSEAVTAPVWAKLADRYGRRPVLIWGFAISVFPAMLVGFSTEVWHIILLRALGKSCLTSDSRVSIGVQDIAIDMQLECLLASWSTKR